MPFNVILNSFIYGDDKRVGTNCGRSEFFNRLVENSFKVSRIMEVLK